MPLQGNCSAGAGAEVEALAATLEGAPLLPLQAGQCLVLTYEDSLPILVKQCAFRPPIIAYVWWMQLVHACSIRCALTVSNACVRIR